LIRAWIARVGQARARRVAQYLAAWFVAGLVVCLAVLAAFTIHQSSRARAASAQNTRLLARLQGEQAQNARALRRALDLLARGGNRTGEAVAILRELAAQNDRAAARPREGSHPQPRPTPSPKPSPSPRPSPSPSPSPRCAPLPVCLPIAT
jgi:hypothetical protein